MAICYDKHFEVKNRWQNQRIDKRYKNQSNEPNDNYYSHDSFKSLKISHFDLKDYDKSIKSNNIPIWNCPRCTYSNIKRKSQCSICNLSYKASKSYKSCNTKISNKPKNNHVTLADFCNNIMDELHQSIPVWICNECTYCNIEQLPQCQMCLNPYSQKKQQQQQQQEEQEEYEYIYGAEQQLIIESVETMDDKEKEKQKCIKKNNKKQYLKSYKSMPTNIINPICDILAPGLEIKVTQKKKIYKKRAKFNMDKLMKLRENKSYKIMPQNIINEIPEILSPELGIKQQQKLKDKTHKKRMKFTINELIKLQKSKQCELMPENIINEIPDILAPGLAIKRIQKKVYRKRIKLNMNELMKFKYYKSCKSMPINVINEIPEILSPGLGLKSQTKVYKKRNKFSMNKLIGLKENKSYKSMPQNIINEISDILSPGLGIKTISKRNKFRVNELKRLQNHKECESMPINIINNIPEILAIGLGSKYKNKLNGSQFNMDRLIKLKENGICDILSPHLRMEKNCKYRMEDGYNTIPKMENIKIDKNKSKKYKISELIKLRMNKECIKMPINIIINNDISEILSVGLGMKKLIKKENNFNLKIGFIAKPKLFKYNKRNYYKWNKIQIYNKYRKSYSYSYYNYNKIKINKSEQMIKTKNKEKKDILKQIEINKNIKMHKKTRKEKKKVNKKEINNIKKIKYKQKMEWKNQFDSKYLNNKFKPYWKSTNHYKQRKW